MNKNTKKNTIEYVRNEIEKIEPTTVLLSDYYVNNKTPLKLLCECGVVFNKTWTTIQNKKTCKCRSCTRKNGWEKYRRKKNFDLEMKQECLNRGFIPLERITHIRQKILCVDKDGYKGKISMTNIRLKKHFSIFGIKCNKDYVLYNLKQYIKNMNLNVNVLHVYSDNAKSCDCTIECKCSCGEIFYTTIGGFISQQKWRCDKCTKRESTFELLIEKELCKYLINYIKQKKFDGCINPKTQYPLRFDFYIPLYNTCIEVDGQQHSIPVNFNGINDEMAINNFNNIQYLDKIKNDYCKNNNIKLLRISYKDIKNNKYIQIIQHLFN